MFFDNLNTARQHFGHDRACQFRETFLLKRCEMFNRQRTVPILYLFCPKPVKRKLFLSFSADNCEIKSLGACFNNQPLHNVSPQLIRFITKIKTTQKNLYLFPSLGHFWGRMVMIWRFQMRRKYLPNQISCWDFRIFFKLDKPSCSSVGFILIDIIFIQEGEIIFFVFHSSHW